MKRVTTTAVLLALAVTSPASAQVFGVPPFIDEFGGVAALADLFGGADGVRALLRAIQKHLYPTDGPAASERDAGEAAA